MPLAAAGSLHPISGKLIRRLARRSQHRLLRAVLLFHDVPWLLIDGSGGSFFLRIRGVKPLIQPLLERADVSRSDRFHYAGWFYALGGIEAGRRM